MTAININRNLELKMNRIGFIQGRLSPLVNDCIQAFPWSSWQDEFKIAEENNFKLMEWTLDQNKLYENPLLTPDGQSEISILCESYNLSIPSLTGDCFMQAPFWKAEGDEQQNLQKDFQAIAVACATVGISMIVVPLVDNGRLDNSAQEDVLVEYLESQESFLDKHNLQVVFESDFNASELARFIDRLNPSLFGINYDIGNSAALGFDPSEEIDAYGNRIINVHVKDRVLGGTTVPLGTGNADFETVFAKLNRIGYTGNYILQTARATDDNHSRILSEFGKMTVSWIEHCGV
jgi:L-ribulose-5-phosphate 3-epimerase